MLSLWRFFILWSTALTIHFSLVSADANAPQAGNDLLVDTTSGLVQGFLDTNTTDVPLKKWLGIPYADDTSGQNRWRPPQPVKVKSGQIVDASAYGPACMQGRSVKNTYFYATLADGHTWQGRWWQWNFSAKRRLSSNQHHGPSQREQFASIYLRLVSAGKCVCLFCELITYVLP